MVSVLTGTYSFWGLHDQLTFSCRQRYSYKLKKIHPYGISRHREHDDDGEVPSQTSTAGQLGGDATEFPGKVESPQLSGTNSHRVHNSTNSTAWKSVCQLQEGLLHSYSCTRGRSLQVLSDSSGDLGRRNASRVYAGSYLGGEKHLMCHMWCRSSTSAVPH